MSIRTLIIDDSATMRALIRVTLSAAPDIEVVGEAADAADARTAIKALKPDVVTLDIEMPNMNGLDFLEKIMRLRPTPVVMCSTLTQRGAEAALRALEIGAVECVGKPVGAVGNFDGLIEKVRTAAHARLRLPSDGQANKEPQPQRFVPGGKIVAIGSSTGGVEALIEVLSNFPPNCPPTVITQHMPANFTRSFAVRLNNCCPATVTEAYDGAALETGRVYLAPGGENHLSVEKGMINGRVRMWCRLRDGPTQCGHKPSVDVLFGSVAAAAGPSAIGVILTGMGRDGSQGLLAMRQAGSRTLGQDENTSVIYGMPKVAFEIGAVERQAPISRMAGHILAFAKARSSLGDQ